MLFARLPAPPFAFLALALLTACAHADGTSTVRAAGLTIPLIAARPEDVATIDAIVDAFYIVTRTTDGPRPYARDRTLYVPDIKFISISGDRAETWDYARYVEMSEPLFREGFDEREIHRELHRYGNAATVLSTYESRGGPRLDNVSRGVNFLLLAFDGTRWWITGVVWQGEDAAHPIPAMLLGNGR